MPAVTPSMTTPISMTRPPAVVTISACDAAVRDERLPVRCAISRYDRMPVSSQKITSRIRLSAQTRPSMAPAKAISEPLYRPRPSSLAGKYRAEYSSTSVPMPAMTSVITIDSASSRRSMASEIDGTHCMLRRSGAAVQDGRDLRRRPGGGRGGQQGEQRSCPPRPIAWHTAGEISATSR